MLLGENNPLHNRDRHISGLLQHTKPDFETTKPDFDTNVKLKNKTLVHIETLRATFGYDHAFGRNNITDVLGLGKSSTSELILKLFSSIALIVAHRKQLGKLLPAYLDNNQRNFLLSRSVGFSHYDVIYLLMKNGYLYTPSEDEQQRICTLIYVQ